MKVHYAITKADISKSKAMFFPAKGFAFTTPPPLAIKYYTGGKAFIPFESYTKYLGSIIHWNVDFKLEVKARRTKTDKAIFATKKLLNDKSLKPETKGKLIKLLILTVLLFNSEAWVLSSEQIKG